MDAAVRIRLLSLAVHEINEAFDRYPGQVLAAGLFKTEDDTAVAHDAWVSALRKVAEYVSSMPPRPATPLEKEAVEATIRRVQELEALYRLGEMDGGGKN